MPLSARQRNALPDSAFVYPSKRKYPVPTKSQARKAGIPEGQRVKMGRSALSRASQANTSGSYKRVAPVVKRRMGGKVASVGSSRGTTSRPGYRKRRGR